MTLKKEPFLKFIGYYLSEGWSSKNIVGVCNSESDIINDMRTVINDLGFKTSEKTYRNICDLKICNKDFRTFIGREFGTNSGNKKIPKWIKSLDKSCLELLFKTYYIGDGNTSQNNFTSKSRQLIDDMSEIVLKLGYAVNRIYYHDGIYKCSFGKRYRETANREGKLHAKNTFEGWVSYNDYVYCVSVPEQKLFVRRNGKPYWSGNSISPTVTVIVNLSGNWRNVLYTEKWDREDPDYILDRIKELYYEYKVNKVFSDSSHKTENMRLLKNAIPVEEISFRKDKEYMQSRLRSFINSETIRIPQSFVALIQELRVYDPNPKKKRHQDFVDALMLACMGGDKDVQFGKMPIIIGKRSDRHQ